MNGIRFVAEKYLFSDKLTLDARLVNATYLVGFFLAIASLITRALMKASPYLLMVISIIAITILVLIYVCNRFHIYKFCTYAAVIMLCYIMLPAAFFFLGGAMGSMVAYFILGLVIICLLIHGKKFFLFISAHFVIASMCIYINSIHPDWVFEFSGGREYIEHILYWDYIQTYLIVGLCIGIIIKCQNRIFLKEQRKTEESVRELEDVQRATELLFNSNPHINFLLDSELNIMDCNPAALEFLKLSDKTELTSRYIGNLPVTLPEALHDINQNAVISITDGLRLMLGRGDTKFETDIYVSGEKRIIALELKHIRSNGQDMIAMYLFDVTDIRRTETELLRRDGMLNAVANAASKLASFSGHFEDAVRDSMALLADSADVDRIYIWKKDVQDEKPVYRQIFEWLNETGAAANTVIKTGVDFIDEIVEWEEKFAKGECVNEIAGTVSEPEKTLLELYDVVSVLVLPIRLQNKFWGFLSFDDCRKAREFTSSEINILQSGGLLVANAILRENMEQALTEAVSEAMAASKAKGDFLSNMSHEIRTPLNAIIGMTAIGRTATDTERKDYAFDKINDASTHLLGVINDILDVSKIEAGKFDLSIEQFNFEKMLHKVSDVITFRVDDKRQHFIVRIDPKIPHVIIGDDQRLAQIITNLLGNSVKFTPEGGSISLDAIFLEEVDDAVTIQIEITDSGIGISKEQQDRLFQSFNQAESGTARKFGGTGLGLAISKQIVEMMGGSIWICSELGKGATFAFTVKVKRGEEVQIPVMSELKWSTIRVLAVDDASDVLEYFAEIAKHFKIHCDTASNAYEALDLISKNGSYDVYFIDWKLPGIDGVELTQRVKALGDVKSSVIMISSGDWSSVENEAKAAGVDRFLSKPLFPSPIMDSIAEVLGVGGAIADNSHKDNNADCFKGHKVLVVEDVEINREIVMALLDPTELSIDTAENGLVAVQMFSEAPDKYEMIFMDVQMPEMDGYEATRKIREMSDERAKSIPIVAMTANVFREDIEKCLKAGMTDHIGKPLDFKAVLEKLRSYLRT